MKQLSVHLVLEEVEGRLVPSAPLTDPLLNAAIAAPNPVATHKVLSLSLTQLDANNDGAIDANYSVSVRVVLDTEVVKLLTLDFTAGSTLQQAEQAAVVQLNAQQAVGTGWMNDAGERGVHIGFLDAQNKYANVDEGSASIFKVNGINLPQPFRLVTRVYDIPNR